MLVKAGAWNHDYIKAEGHHIEARLDEVKTIDIVHEKGFTTGRSDSNSATARSRPSSM